LQEGRAALSSHDALQQLVDHAEGFTTAELDELRPLFGLYGVDNPSRVPPDQLHPGYLEERWHYWQGFARDRKPVRQAIAERATTRYGLLLHDLAAPS
jgi:hypothetical protein